MPDESLTQEVRAAKSGDTPAPPIHKRERKRASERAEAQHVRSAEAQQNRPAEATQSHAYRDVPTATATME